MMPLVMVFAAALAVAMSSGTVYAKMVMQTFPVLAGAGAHDVYPAPDGTVWFYRAIRGQTRPLRSSDRQIGSDRAWAGRGAPRCDRWARRRRLGHRRWTERNRPSRS